MSRTCERTVCLSEWRGDTANCTKRCADAVAPDVGGLRANLRRKLARLDGWTDIPLSCRADAALVRLLHGARRARWRVEWLGARRAPLSTYSRHTVRASMSWLRRLNSLRTADTSSTAARSADRLALSGEGLAIVCQNVLDRLVLLLGGRWGHSKDGSGRVWRSRTRSRWRRASDHDLCRHTVVALIRGTATTAARRRRQLRRAVSSLVCRSGLGLLLIQRAGLLAPTNTARTECLHLPCKRVVVLSHSARDTATIDRSRTLLLRVARQVDRICSIADLEHGLFIRSDGFCVRIRQYSITVGIETSAIRPGGIDGLCLGRRRVSRASSAGRARLALCSGIRPTTACTDASSVVSRLEVFVGRELWRREEVMGPFGDALEVRRAATRALCRCSDSLGFSVIDEDRWAGDGVARAVVVDESFHVLFRLELLQGKTYTLARLGLQR